MGLSSKTDPIFIVGCGRSGTQAIAQLFSCCNDVEMHHEFMVHLVQPLGVKYFHGLVEKAQVLSSVSEIYEGAVYYCDKKIWGDSSNKLSWLISELSAVFPTAKFIHIVRDGRKVTSSLFHKLGDECLDDKSTRIMRGFLEGKSEMCPPPEKKYWWPQALKGKDEYRAYQELDQFGRIAFHWAQLNNHVDRQLQELSPSQYVRVRLEDITSNKVALFAMMRFVGVTPRDEHFTMMQRPHNVVRPENNLLTPEQLDVFWFYCTEVMERYGYVGTEEYELNYKSSNGPAGRV